MYLGSLLGRESSDRILGLWRRKRNRIGGFVLVGRTVIGRGVEGLVGSRRPWWPSLKDFVRGGVQDLCLYAVDVVLSLC